MTGAFARANTLSDRQKWGHRVRLGVGDDTTLTNGGHFLELTKRLRLPLQRGEKAVGPVLRRHAVGIVRIDQQRRFAFM